MYSRKVKFVMIMMVLLMSVGYLVLLLTGLPGFQSLITGTSSGNGATKSLIEKSEAIVKERDCREGMKGAADIKACTAALKDLGAGYLTLAAPEQGATEAPKDSERNRKKALEAFTLLFAIAPDDVEAIELFASALSAEGKYEEAATQYLALSKIDPDNDLYLLAWAQNLDAAQKADEAIKAYKVYVKRFPDESNTALAKEAITRLQDAKENPQAAGQNITVG